MWIAYHICAHLSYLFHLISKHSIIFFRNFLHCFHSSFFSKCVSVCVPFRPVFSCICMSLYLCHWWLFSFFSSHSWSNNISFIFYVNFIRFDVIKKTLFLKILSVSKFEMTRLLREKKKHASLQIYTCIHILLAEILNSSEILLMLQYSFTRTKVVI